MRACGTVEWRRKRVSFSAETVSSTGIEPRYVNPGVGNRRSRIHSACFPAILSNDPRAMHASEHLFRKRARTKTTTKKTQLRPWRQFLRLIGRPGNWNRFWEAAAGGRGCVALDARPPWTMRARVLLLATSIVIVATFHASPRSLDRNIGIKEWSLDRLT